MGICGLSMLRGRDLLAAIQGRFGGLATQSTRPFALLALLWQCLKVHRHLCLLCLQSLRSPRSPRSPGTRRQNNSDSRFRFGFAYVSFISFVYLSSGTGVRNLRTNPCWSGAVFAVQHQVTQLATHDGSSELSQNQNLRRTTSSLPRPDRLRETAPVPFQLLRVSEERRLEQECEEARRLKVRICKWPVRWHRL